MTYKMYLLNICDLEDKGLAQEALALIDDQRRALVDKYAIERDRVRAIAAGLLLQLGFLELGAEEIFCKPVEVSENESDVSGVSYILEAESVVRYLRQTGTVQLLYHKAEHGKPYWDREVLERFCKNKKLWHFNLSHSGNYVALAVADAEVGVDIQEPREQVRFPGGIDAFSRMESYVKCTGEGYAQGYCKYKKYQGKVPGYRIQSIDIIEQYALYICFQDSRLGK